jgi:Bacterial protein of unknown function (DUF882)
MGGPERAPQPPPMVRAVSVIFGAALASLPVASPLTTDPPLPRPDHPGGSSLARRKDPLPASDEAAPVPTLGTVFNLHTLEMVPLSEAEPSAERFSDLLADKGLRASIPVEPRLLALLRALARPRPGVRVDIVSGYRSPKRNEMMRKKGRHVASHSQHTLGHAVDFRVEGLGVPELVKAIDAEKWDGGLGRYDGRGDLFVHADVGPKRRWNGQ